MNRSASLLFAFGVLLAHALVLCQDALGHLARPPDEVHVAFRMARNLVRSGSAAFNAGEPLLESYPSHLWIALSALADRIYLGPNHMAQGASMLAALGTVLVVSRFSPARLAGVMAPMFVVVSGSFAAAALSGTEWTTFALVCALGLLMLEEGRPRMLALVASLAVVVRPEGVLLVLALAALSLASRSRRRGADEPVPGQASVGLAPFAFALAVWIAIGVARTTLTGSFFAPVLLDAFAVDASRFATGTRYVGDFFLRSGAMTLAVVPLAFALFGGLTPRGRRALALGVAWCLWVAWQGGDTLAMWQAMVPAVPFLAVAIQEALTQFMDTERPVVLRVAWTLFLVGLGASVLASRRPADLGPLPTETLQREWMRTPVTEAIFGVRSGRMGLVQRVADDERRRCAAIFVRENLDADATVGTLWPGAVGYLSGRPVVDLRGRATAGPDGRVRGDFGPRALDLVAAFEADEPDFLLPPLPVEDLRPREVAARWLEVYDRFGADPERVTALAAVLERYELVSVPIPVHSSTPGATSPEPYGLLRHQRLGSPTELRMRGLTDRVVVEVRHAGHQQVVDLSVAAVDADGGLTFARPSGLFDAQRPGHVRSNLLLHNSGRRWIRLCELPLDRVPDVERLRASLVAPGSVASAAGESRDTGGSRVEVLWRLRERESTGESDDGTSDTEMNEGSGDAPPTDGSGERPPRDGSADGESGNGESTNGDSNDG